MSLINDMLKKLEERKVEPKNGMHWGHDLLTDYEEETPFVKALITAIVICAIVALIAYGIFEYHKHKQHHAAVVPPTLKANAPTQAQAPTNVIQPVASATTLSSGSAAVPPPPRILSNISFNDLAAQIVVNLSFTDTPTYLTNMNNATHTLTLTLQNAYLEQNKLCQSLGKPANCMANKTIPIPINSDAIQSISIEQNDGQALVLDFHLSAQASFATSVVVNQNNTPNLAITINKNNSVTGGSQSVTTQPPSTAQNITENDNTLPVPSDSILQPVMADQTVAKQQAEYRKIDTFIEDQNFNQAAKLFSQLTSSQKSSVQGTMLKAKLLMGQGQQEQALDLMQKYPVQNPPADYLALYAALLEFNGQHTRAMTIYQRLVSFWPNNSDWWLGLGISALHSNNNEIAMNAFNHVLTFENLNPQVAEFVRDRLADLRIS